MDLVFIIKYIDMSADNWIYILHTKDKYKQTWYWIYENMFDNKINAYRVAHVQAIENYNYILENEPYNIWAYMVDVWWGSDVYYNKEDAYKKAEEIEKYHEWTEYGISTIDATDMSFYF